MGCCGGGSYIQNYNKQGMTREERIAYNYELGLKNQLKKETNVELPKEPEPEN